MSLNPAVQKKAQAELDTVVGSDRFPDHSDKESLPYVHAVVKEALRWQNAMPFSLPHLTSEDMEYRGYFIPRGTVLSPQTWYALCNQSCVPRLLLTSPWNICAYRACLHDDEAYPEPERFLPDRFIRDGKLDPDVRDPLDFAFGYGRRYV